MPVANPAVICMVLLVTLAYACPAAAGNKTIVLTVSGETVNLVLPEGACAYDRANPIDAKIISNLEKANAGMSDVLIAFAGCRDIEALHSGKQVPPTEDYGQILTPVGREKVQDYTRAEFVSKATDSYRDAGVFEEGTEKATDILRSVTSRGLDGSSPVMLGVIRKDPDFIEVAMLQGLPDGKEIFPMATVAATTKLDVPVTINFYHLYTDEASLSALATRAAAYTRQLAALNPDKSGLPASHAAALAQEEEESSVWFSFKSNWQVIVIGGLAGAFIGGVYQRIQKNRKKRKS